MGFFSGWSMPQREARAGSPHSESVSRTMCAVYEPGGVRGGNQPEEGVAPVAHAVDAVDGAIRGRAWRPCKPAGCTTTVCSMPASAIMQISSMRSGMTSFSPGPKSLRIRCSWSSGQPQRAQSTRRTWSFSFFLLVQPIEGAVQHALAIPPVDLAEHLHSHEIEVEALR